MKYQWQAILVALVLTSLSYSLGVYFNWTMTEGWLLFVEVGAVFASYWCTYLCVFQTRTNYWIAAVSVILLGILFYEQQLYASAAVQGFLLFIQLPYGYFRWRKDEDTRPVKRIWDDKKWIPAYLLATGLAYAGCYGLNVYLGGSLALMDTAILVLTILSQFLLDNKRLENWILWFIVDVISVIVYVKQGLLIVAVQMGLFGLNAIWGYYMWNKTRIEDTKLV